MAINNSKAFDALAIRDTSPHTSDIIYNGEFVVKTLIVENSLNQTVSIQCYGSNNPDFTNSFMVGEAWDVTAGTNVYQTCDSYIPYYRAVATCSVAPASGTMTLIVLGVS